MAPVFVDDHDVALDIRMTMLVTGSIVTCLSITVLIILCCGKEKKAADAKQADQPLAQPDIPPILAGKSSVAKSAKDDKSKTRGSIKADSIAASKMASLNMQSLKMQDKKNRKNRSYGKIAQGTPGSSMVEHKVSSFQLMSDHRARGKVSREFHLKRTKSSRAAVKSTKSTRLPNKSVKSFGGGKGSMSTGGAKMEDTKTKTKKEQEPKEAKSAKAEEGGEGTVKRDKKLPKYLRPESTHYGIPRTMEM